MKPKNMFYTFLFLNLLFSSCVYSQKYNSVDSIADGYSKDLSNADELVKLVNKDFSQPDEKARAVFRWVATNVSYDVALAESIDIVS